VNNNIKMQGGYRHFFAGDYLSDIGADSDADFACLTTALSS
jgi:hypothetical protein